MDNKPQTANPKSKTASQSRAEVADSEIVGSQAEAALFLGKSTRTIRRYEKEGMPTAARNGKKVYIKSILLLYAANEGKKPTQAKIKKEEGSAELTQARAENERFDLEIKKGEWVRKADYDRDNLRKIITVKRALLGQGRKLAMQLAAMTEPRKIQSLLDKENRAIIEGFAR